MTDVPGGLDEPDELQPAEGSLRLVGDRDQYDAAAWEAATAAVLRKARRLGEDAPDSDVWPALTRTTLDGVEVAPIGQPADLDGLATAGRPQRPGAWDVRTQVEVVDAKAANEAALQDLENGATSLLLHLDQAQPHDWSTLLDGVLLDLAPVALDRPSAEQVEAFADFLEGVEGALHPATNLSFDLQTLEMLPFRVRDDGVGARDLFAPVARRGFQLGVRALVVDGTALHDKGASDAQELGWAIATGVAYLRLLADADFSVEHAARLVEFRLAATDEQFPTIAKLRAARRLWTRVLEASGVDAGARTEMALHAVTSRPMTSRQDPWVNMLRGTVAAFAAGCRRRRRRDSGAVRRAAGPARRVRPPHRPQHVLAPDRGVPRRHGHRPGRRFLRRREAHRRPRRRRAGRSSAASRRTAAPSRTPPGRA